jgi:hypothetical protein
MTMAEIKKIPNLSFNFAALGPVRSQPAETWLQCAVLQKLVIGSLLEK